MDVDATRAVEVSYPALVDKTEIFIRHIHPQLEKEDAELAPVGASYGLWVVFW